MVDQVDEGGSSPSIMVIQVWHEPGHEQGFRARLMSNPGTGSDPQVSVVAGPEEVVESVRIWLAELTGTDVPAVSGPS